MRPSKYQDDFPLKLVEHMEDGLSFESFGAKADCCRDTLYEWLKKHPEFSDAKKRGEIRSLHAWEQIGRDYAWGLENTYEMVQDSKGNVRMQQKPFNPATYIYTMKCRFRKYGWNDQELSEKDTDKIAEKLNKLGLKKNYE